MNTAMILSPPRARLTGMVYLLYLVGIELAWILVDRIPDLCRAALLLSSVCYLVLAILFYGMFKPVNNRIALEASLFGVVGSILGILHLFDFVSQVRTIPFLAGFILLTGYLIVRSAFLPRILGGLMMLAGLGWLAFLYPPIAVHMHGHMSDFSFLVEGLLMLWLLVKGVDVPRWNSQSRASVPVEA